MAETKVAWLKMNDVDLMMGGRRGLESQLVVAIDEGIKREAVKLAAEAVQKRLSSTLAKIAIRQRPKARAWARHHMRRVAKEV